MAKRKKVGHTITLPTETLKLRLVEAWLGIKKYPAKVYEAKMTGWLNEYYDRTGKWVGTVGGIEPLEKWYASLSEDRKDKIRSAFKIEPVYANPKRKKRVRKGTRPAKHFKMIPAGKGRSRRTVLYAGELSRAKQHRTLAAGTVLIEQEASRIRITAPKIGLETSIRYASVEAASRAYKNMTSVARAVAVLRRHGKLTDAAYQKMVAAKKRVEEKIRQQRKRTLRGSPAGWQ